MIYTFSVLIYISHNMYLWSYDREFYILTSKLDIRVRALLANSKSSTSMLGFLQKKNSDFSSMTLCNNRNDRIEKSDEV